MSDKLEFVGKVVRTEPGGFGVVEFDRPIGPKANTHGIISSSNGTAIVGITHLKTGIRVKGTAKTDDRDLAAIETIVVAEN
jgi:hypothetical protein